MKYRQNPPDPPHEPNLSPPTPQDFSPFPSISLLVVKGYVRMNVVKAVKIVKAVRKGL